MEHESNKAIVSSDSSKNTRSTSTSYLYIETHDTKGNSLSFTAEVYGN